MPTLDLETPVEAADLPDKGADAQRQLSRLSFDTNRALWKPKTVIKDLERDLAHGWLLPYLLPLESVMWGRWDYWTELMTTGALPDEPIPQIHFGKRDPRVMKMLEVALDSIPNFGGGGWRCWSSFEYFRFFLEFMLHGFGHPGHENLPREIGGCAGASMRLYQTLDIGMMLLHPYDYLGDIAAEMHFGRQAGFFPTPHELCELMTMIVIPGEADNRLMTMMDPCVGTGRMPLHASNHTLRLYGQEILREMVFATLVNGYLYAPWLVRPIPWIEGRDRDNPRALSESMTRQAPPHTAQYLADTIFDEEEQLPFLPIVRRIPTNRQAPVYKVYEFDKRMK